MQYPKIPNLYYRDPSTNQIDPDRFSREEFFSLHRLDWTALEKIDGTNIRVQWDGNRVTFAGKTDRAQLPLPLLQHLEDTFGGSENEELFEQMFEKKEVVVYCEGFGPKIQKGHVYSDHPEVNIIDVKVGQTFLSWEDVEGVARGLGVHTVPLVFREIDLESASDLVAHGVMSAYNHDILAEGLVVRPPHGLRDRHGGRLLAKIKTEDFHGIKFPCPLTITEIEDV